jgi:hypothetical protein
VDLCNLEFFFKIIVGGWMATRPATGERRGRTAGARRPGAAVRPRSINNLNSESLADSGLFTPAVLFILAALLAIMRLHVT